MLDERGEARLLAAVRAYGFRRECWIDAVMIAMVAIEESPAEAAFALGALLGSFEALTRGPEWS